MDRDPSSPSRLEQATAADLARVALANVGTEYPFHLAHLVQADADLAPPRALHPVFFGSYDWHSCVHMHWTLLRCLRRHPRTDFGAAVRDHFDARFTPAGVARERAYFADPGRSGFERPYGWGWLLKLQAELTALAIDDGAAAHWRDTLDPLALDLAGRLLDFLPRADFPVRAGTHGNSAFALLLALDYAQATQHRALVQSIGQRARRWFGQDRRYPASYEPSGDDFLSAGLVEARLMQRVLDDCDYADWWQAFEPSADGLARWLAPVAVSDASDPKIVHLHGLNLARAWCWRGLRPALPPTCRGGRGNRGTSRAIAACRSRGTLRGHALVGVFRAAGDRRRLIRDHRAGTASAPTHAFVARRPDDAAGLKLSSAAPINGISLVSFRGCAG